jgi:hypothetical protein
MTWWRVMVALVLGGGASAFGQFDGPGSPGVSASLIRLFGTNTAFSAQVQYQLLGKDNQERIGAPMKLARLNNRIRVDVDMAQMRHREEADAMAKLKPLGLDQVVSVIRPDLGVTLVAFPKLRSVVKLPMPPQEADAFVKPGKMERTRIGQENMEGHPCVKYRVVALDDQGKRHEATVWNATDMRDFPVCVATREGTDTVIMRFRQVQFVRPDAATFESPAGFTESASIEALMAGPAAKYFLSGSGKAKPSKTPAPASKPKTTTNPTKKK